MIVSKNLTYAEKIIADAYLELAEEALRNPKRIPEKIVRCCKCGRCNVTLRKIHTDVYACSDCIEIGVARELEKDFKKRNEEAKK